MSTRQCWLVERSLWDEDLVTLVYATEDGEYHHRRQLSGALLAKTAVTAALSVPEDELEPTPGDEIDRYSSEATRMAEEHDPEDEV